MNKEQLINMIERCQNYIEHLEERIACEKFVIKSCRKEIEELEKEEDGTGK